MIHRDLSLLVYRLRDSRIYAALMFDFFQIDSYKGIIHYRIIISFHLVIKLDRNTFWCLKSLGQSLGQKCYFKSMEYEFNFSLLN